MLGGIPTGVLVILPIAGLIFYPLWIDHQSTRQRGIELIRLVGTLFITTAIATAAASILGNMPLSASALVFSGLVGTGLFMLGNGLRALYETR